MRDLTGSLPEQCPLEYSKKGRTLIPVPSRLSPRSPTARSLGIFALLAARDRANRITPSNCPQLPITRTSQSQILFPNTRCYGFIKKKKIIPICRQEDMNFHLLWREKSVSHKCIIIADGTFRVLFSRYHWDEE